MSQAIGPITLQHSNAGKHVYSQAKLLGESQGLTKESEVYESEEIEQQKPEKFACSSKHTFAFVDRARRQGLEAVDIVTERHTDFCGISAEDDP